MLFHLLCCGLETMEKRFMCFRRWRTCLHETGACSMAIVRRRSLCSDHSGVACNGVCRRNASI